MTEIFNRIHVIVIDSVGIGEAPDAAQFDDFDVDTLGHIAREKGGLKLPNLSKLGLSNIRSIQGVPVADSRWPTMEKCRKNLVGKIR